MNNNFYCMPAGAPRPPEALKKKPHYPRMSRIKQFFIGGWIGQKDINQKQIKYYFKQNTFMILFCFYSCHSKHSWIEFFNRHDLFGHPQFSKSFNHLLYPEGLHL